MAARSAIHPVPMIPTRNGCCMCVCYCGLSVLLFSDDDAATGLMCGEYEYFGYLHMCGSIGSKDGNVGDVVGSEGLDAFVDVVGSVVIAMEASKTYAACGPGDEYGFLHDATWCISDLL